MKPAQPKKHCQSPLRKYPHIALFFLFMLALPVFTPKIYGAEFVSLFLNDPPAQIEEGEKITLTVKVDAKTQPINAVSGTLYFPTTLLRVVALEKNDSIFNIWTQEPKLFYNRISFEGVILNPGFQGENGTILRVTFEAKKAGAVHLRFSEGAILANDGLGTNVLSAMGSADFKIIPAPNLPSPEKPAEKPEENNSATPETSQLVLPTITKYFSTLGPKEILYLRGKGGPEALTKIIFQNLSVESWGEKLIKFLQSEKKEMPNDILIKNDANGIFRFVSKTSLTAGTYNIIPIFVNQKDANAEIPGPSVQILVNDNEVVKAMVVILNIMLLLIPLVSLAVLIYFIPWYFWRKMRVMKEKMLLEEEKIKLNEEELKKRETGQNL